MTKRKRLERLGLSFMAFMVTAACDLAGVPTEVTSLENGSLRGAADDSSEVAALRRLVQERPEDPALRKRLGDLYLKTGDGAAAESAYRRAAELGFSGDLASEIGWAMMIRGDYSALLRYLPAPEQIADDDVELLYLRSVADLRFGTFSDAAALSTFIRLGRLAAEGDAVVGPELELGDALAALRTEFEIVERALQHHECTLASAAPSIYPELETPDTDRRVLRVGPGRRLTTPSSAALEAEDGDVIEIDYAVYADDVAVWRQDNLTLRGIGGRPHMQSSGVTARDQGIWVFVGDAPVIDNIEFSGARSSGKNGAGIRLLGSGATIRRSFFHDNENGILGGRGESSDIVIEHSEFVDNGAGDGQSHNVYIGAARSLTFRFNYSAGARIGHLLKSRAERNLILYNRLADTPDGRASYIVDLPEGGRAVLMGNELRQSHLSENPAVFSFGAEADKAENAATRENSLYFAYNTVYNQLFGADVVRNVIDADALVLNNLIAGGPADILNGAGEEIGNVYGAGALVADGRAGVFDMSPGSLGIDSAATPPADLVVELSPEWEYVHPARARLRMDVWKRDVGAHEFCGF